MPNQTVKSLSVRLIHWGIALSVFLVVFFLEDGDAPHRYAGYFALSLVALKVVLSLKNKEESQTGFLKNLVHILIWGLVVLLALTGWMMSLDRFWGEDWLERIHEYLSHSLKVLVLLHLLGVFWDAYKFKRPTWLLMVTGRNHRK